MSERRRANSDWDTPEVMPWEPLPGTRGSLLGTDTDERPKKPVLYLPDGTPLTRHRPFGFRPPEKR